MIKTSSKNFKELFLKALKFNTTLKSKKVLGNIYEYEIANLFYDIETLQMNTDATNPKDRIVKEYIVMFGFSKLNTDYRKQLVFCCNTLKEFIKILEELLIIKNEKPLELKLLAHNANKYDNHFLLRSLKEAGYKEFNKDQKDKANYIQKHFKHIIDTKPKEVLVSRVKSSTNLDLGFRISDLVSITTGDTKPKINASLSKLGENLVKMKLLDKEDQKQGNYAYTQYDTPDIKDDNYIKSIYKNLSKEELLYCKNDIKVLQAFNANFQKLTKDTWNFDLMSQTQNILNDYTQDNIMSKLDLLNKFGRDGQKQKHIEYSKFKSPDNYFSNLFDYINTGYFGGLNIFNEKYLNKDVKDVIACDINSSYPYAMYKEKYAYVMNGYTGKTKIYLDDVFLDDENFYLFSIDLKEYNKLSNLIQSKQIKIAFHKMHNKNKDVIIVNSVSLRILKDICHLDNLQLNVRSSIRYLKKENGVKEKIAEFYFIKQIAGLIAKGKMPAGKTIDTEKSIPTKVVFRDLLPGETLPEYTLSQVDIAKINLNGIYGAPALAAYFNAFTIDETGKMENQINGISNNERNVLFSLQTTSYAFYNLLSTFKNLSPKEIDENWIYSDTDSIYVKKAIKDRLHIDINDYNLGAWDCEYLTQFKVLNHKQYIYEKDGKLIIKLAGVAKSELKKYEKTSYNDFTKIFTYGTNFKNLVSCVCKDGGVALIERDTEIKKPNKYKLRFTITERIQMMMLLAEAYEKITAINPETNVEEGEAIFFEIGGVVYSPQEVINFFHKPEKVDEKELMSLDDLMKIQTNFVAKISRIQYAQNMEITPVVIREFLEQKEITKRKGREGYNFKNLSEKFKGLTARVKTLNKYNYLRIEGDRIIGIKEFKSWTEKQFYDKLDEYNNQLRKKAMEKLREEYSY